MGSSAKRGDVVRHALTRGLVALAVALVAAPLLLAAFSPDALAQEQRRRWFSLRELFAPRRERVEPEIDRPPASNVAPKRVVKPPQKKHPVPREPELVIAPKAPDARTVLVIGDFLGGALANGLNQAYADNTHVAVIDRTQASSGLVRNDVMDWPKGLKALVEKEKPSAILVMLGANDRQSMRVGGDSQPLGSEKWTTEYVARIDALTKALADTKLPFAWLGLPSFKSSRMSDDMLVLNELYRASAGRVDGQFIDVWDGFVDENGAFSSTGPDVSGQPVRLRTGDGINFTAAGKRKLAFFAEKPLARMLGLSETGEPAVAALPDASLSPGDAGAGDRTPPMSLNDPALDGGTELLGATVESGGAKQRPGAEPDVSARAASGRADDFLWARQAAEPASGNAEATASTR